MPFIESWVQMSQRSRHAYRWKVKDKMLVLSILFHSRKAYKILSCFFILPSIRTLLCDLQKMKIKPGFSESVPEALKVKVNAMDFKDKNNVLVFEEMSIKEGLLYNVGRDVIERFEDFSHIGKTRYIANHAIAFMIRGLASKWKQPIGYFLSSGPVRAKTLQSLTRVYISKVTETGLNVVALVCDQGYNNWSFILHLEKVTIDRPHLMYKNRKYLYFMTCHIYDMPHVRNNLKKADLRINEGVVNWQHIVDFYNFGKCQPVQMAPKLKDRCIELTPFSAMQVNLAAQVLGHSISARITALVTLKHLPDWVKDTAQFVEHFDGLFNTSNSWTVKLHKG